MKNVKEITIMAKMRAYCVVEMAGTNLLKCEVFSDDAEGKEQAVKLFQACLAENKCEADDTPDAEYLDDGWYDDGNEYQLFIACSTG